jgi:hypothetical protein
VALVDELLVTAGQLRTQLAQLPLVLPEQGALVRILVDHSLVLDVLGPGNAWQTARQTFGNRNTYVYGVCDGGAHPRDLRDNAVLFVVEPWGVEDCIKCVEILLQSDAPVGELQG